MGELGEEGKGRWVPLKHIYTCVKSSSNKENYRKKKLKGFNIVAGTLEQTLGLCRCGGRVSRNTSHIFRRRQWELGPLGNLICCCGFVTKDPEVKEAAPPTGTASGISDFQFILSYRSYWFPLIARDLWEGLTRSVSGFQPPNQDLTLTPPELKKVKLGSSIHSFLNRGMVINHTPVPGVATDWILPFKPCYIQTHFLNRSGDGILGNNCEYTLLPMLSSWGVWELAWSVAFLSHQHENLRSGILTTVVMII